MTRPKYVYEHRIEELEWEIGCLKAKVMSLEKYV